MVEIIPRSREEQWADIPGWEGQYQASDYGRVRSLDMQTPAGRRRGRILTPWVTKWGYLQVHLSRSGKRSARPVHQLVLDAFVGMRPEGAEACHADADRKNNRLTNLRWDTVSENRNDIVRAGHHHLAKRVSCSRGHSLTGANLRIANDGSRVCVSCQRAHSYARNVLRQPITQDLADAYFRKLVAA